ncbi:MAG: phosphotransferase [Intrasporangium sp.]|uniref:phosphotransferase n=1 Tax=Intrasporangium sp. TaxID=1925024 RepID=UPI0026478796|nr:phosphotransferase [Intrasporangium sp.]MDN5797242.1 phosphotransferase [Intrasporangium sp.]
MSRSALRLAALASSAVPGLDPVSVTGVPVGLGDLYEVAFVTDSQDRRWVARAGRTAAADTLLEDVGGLMSLLAHRLEIALPVIRGVSVGRAGRAVVHARVPGQPLRFAALPPGVPLAAGVGRTLAHIHNIELAVFEEAGRPSYDAESHRRRMLSELDRASASGHVPSGLLSRWEYRLEDISLWRFAPTPVHGAYTGSHVLASFDDPDDAGSGRVRGVIGWEQARVADPADDLAELVRRAHPAALDTVLEAYTQSRIERPDANLMARARLAAEMSLVHRLLAALSATETRLVEQVSAQLRKLDRRTREAEEHAKARRIEAERAARRERTQAQVAAVSVPATTAAREGPSDGAEAEHGAEAAVRAGNRHPEDEATQPFTPANGPVDNAGFDEATQPFTPANGPVEAEHGVIPLGSADDAEFEAATEASEADAPPTDEPLAMGSRTDAPPAVVSPTETAPPADGVSLVQAEGDGDPVDDRHEGASEFVPLGQRGPRNVGNQT